MTARVCALAARLELEENAATAAITMVLMLALLGFMSLAVDAGVLFVNRTELQKAADAAALAGAYDYTITSGGSCSQTNNATDAETYAAYNHVLAPDTILYNGPPATPPNLGSGIYCFWQVTVQRSVPLVFAPLVGHSNWSAVEARAIAYKSPVSGVSNPVPYALWGGNTDNYNLPSDPPETGEPYDICGVTGVAGPTCTGLASDSDSGLNTNGTLVYFKQNKWQDLVYPTDPKKCGGVGKPPCNGNWLVKNSASFKGYLHINNAPNIYYSPGQTVDSQGGNANATELCQMASNGQPGALLVATPACDGTMGCPAPLKTPPSGQIDFLVAAIRAVWLNQAQACATNFTGGDLSGTICLPSADPRCVVAGGKPGGNDPNAPTVVKLAL